MSIISGRLKWGLSAILLYSAHSFMGASVNYLGHKLQLSGLSYGIVANVLTTTQGLFTGIFSFTGILQNDEFFKYSEFHLSSFILGGLIWFLFAQYLYIKSSEIENLVEKRSYIASIFIKSGCASFIISIFITITYIFVSEDYEFFPLVMIYLSVVYVPLLLIGLVFKMINKGTRVR